MNLPRISLGKSKRSRLPDFIFGEAFVLVHFFKRNYGSLFASERGMAA